MSSHEIREFRGAGGVKLFARVWKPDEGEVRGDWFWIHGVAEHGGRYPHIVRRLNELGWRVIIADLRGHGLSSGVRTHVDSVNTYVDDLAEVYKSCDIDAKRAVVFGHSMGGLVAIRGLQSGAFAPAALVLSSPLLKIRLPVEWYKRFFGPLIRRLAPRLRFPTGISAGDLTPVSRFRQLRQGDPLMQRTVTISWFYAIQQALSAAWSDRRPINCPVVVLQGECDPVVDTSAAEAWLVERAPSREVLTISGGRHELLNDDHWRISLDQIQDALSRLLPQNAGT